MVKAVSVKVRMFGCKKKPKKDAETWLCRGLKSPLQGMEKLSELTSTLLSVFTSSQRTGDKKRLGKSKNRNKANSVSDLQGSEAVYVSLWYMGQSEGYVNLEATPSPHSFPLCVLVDWFVWLFVFCSSNLMFLRLFMLLLPWLAGRDCWGARESQILVLGTTATSFKLHDLNVFN